MTTGTDDPLSYACAAAIAFADAGASSASPLTVNARPHSWHLGALAALTASQPVHGFNPSMPPQLLQYVDSNGLT